jgi:uncharacterized membrane protein YdcZ (DUF606 family)
MDNYGTVQPGSFRKAEIVIAGLTKATQTNLMLRLLNLLQTFVIVSFEAFTAGTMKKPFSGI